MIPLRKGFLEELEKIGAIKAKKKPLWGKRLSAKERFVLSRGGSMKKGAGPSQDVSSKLPSTPVPKKVVMNLAAKAEKVAFPAEVNPSMSILHRMVGKRREIAKLAGIAKKQITCQGVTLKLEHLKGDVRSGTNGSTGESWSRKMHDHYGYVPGTSGKGADGKAIDVYLNPDEGSRDEACHVYKIRQKKRTGEYDEDKFMVGYSSADAAKKAFLRNMPEWAFGSMNSVPLTSFKKLVGQSVPRGTSTVGVQEKEAGVRSVVRKIRGVGQELLRRRELAKKLGVSMADVDRVMAIRAQSARRRKILGGLVTGAGLAAGGWAGKHLAMRRDDAE